MNKQSVEEVAKRSGLSKKMVTELLNAGWFYHENVNKQLWVKE